MRPLNPNAKLQGDHDPSSKLKESAKLQFRGDQRKNRDVRLNQRPIKTPFARVAPTSLETAALGSLALELPLSFELGRLSFTPSPPWLNCPRDDRSH